MRGQRALLEAWTSAIEMDVLASGALVNRRMDLLVGSFSRGVPGIKDESLTQRFPSHAASVFPENTSAQQ